MATTRAEILSAIELATLVLSAADSAANHRDPFISMLGLDPMLIGQGRGRRAAHILQAVLTALRERSEPPRGTGQRAESDDKACTDDIRHINNGQGDDAAHKVHHAVRRHE
jgi:hypothetical protein